MRSILHPSKMIITAALLLVNSCSYERGHDKGAKSAQIDAIILVNRFNRESYQGCDIIPLVLEPDYRALARRRISTGRNVFLYHDNINAEVDYSGIHNENGEISEDVRRMIAAGGSWGVYFPDTGCPNMDRFYYEEEYMRLYNAYALEIFRNTNSGNTTPNPRP